MAAVSHRRAKSIPHYILLPSGATAPELWALAGRLALRNAGTVGFSAAEAKLAARVTVLASPDRIDERVTADLERSGSRVERLDPAEVSTAMDELGTE